MEELEGYLQCFDEKDRNYVKERYVKYGKQHLTQWFFLSYAFFEKKTTVLHKLIDMGCDTTHVIENCPFDAITRLLYDRGFTCCRVKPSHASKLQQFMHCRDCARKAAIAVLSLFSDGRAAAVGRNRKDVGRIIGRAIWASRGIKEWTN